MYEISDPGGLRFHSTLGLLVLMSSATVKRDAFKSLIHCARCSLAKRSTHFNSTMTFSSTTKSAAYSPRYFPLYEIGKPEPWRGHPVKQAHGSKSKLVGRPSPGNQRRSRWPPRRQRQSRLPSDPIPVRVHPWPNCMSGARWVKISEKLLPGHGWTRIHTNFIIQLFRGHYTRLVDTL